MAEPNTTKSILILNVNELLFSNKINKVPIQAVAGWNLKT